MQRILLCALFLVEALSSQAFEVRDTVPETPMSDTLRTVVVTDDGRLPIYVSDEVKRRIGTKGLSDLIGGKANDKIMHPFAVRQRKRERHQRKMAKILQQYDMVESERDLLLEALRREGIDPDSLMNAYREKEK